MSLHRTCTEYVVYYPIVDKRYDVSEYGRHLDDIIQLYSAEEKTVSEISVWLFARGVGVDTSETGRYQRLCSFMRSQKLLRTKTENTFLKHKKGWRAGFRQVVDRECKICHDVFKGTLNHSYCDRCTPKDRS